MAKTNLPYSKLGLSVVVYACSLSTWEIREKDHEFDVSLSYTAIFCPKTAQSKTKQNPTNQSIKNPSAN